MLQQMESTSLEGVYVGNSTYHSGAIPLIYNLKTTHICPQFHILFDENFTTATNKSSADADSYLKKVISYQCQMAV